MLGQRKTTGRVATIVVGCALLAGACRTDREITRPDPEPITEDRLTEALLTPEDVPGPYEAAAEGTSIDTEIIPEHECDDAISEFKPKESATIDFTGTGLDTVLTSSVAWFPGRGGAVGRVFREVAKDCAEVVVAEEELSFVTTNLDFGVLSDDTLALKFELEKADGSIEERDLIVMRVGDLVSVIRLTGPRPSDKVLLDAVTRVAIGRLGLLDEET